MLDDIEPLLAKRAGVGAGGPPLLQALEAELVSTALNLGECLWLHLALADGTDLLLLFRSHCAYRLPV